MTHYQACLEIAADGRCLAHILDLPGCIVRAPSGADALARMSEADLEQTFPFPWGPEETPYQWVAVYVDHARSHARGLRAHFAQRH